MMKLKKIMLMFGLLVVSVETLVASTIASLQKKITTTDLTAITAVETNNANLAYNTTRDYFKARLAVDDVLIADCQSLATLLSTVDAGTTTFTPIQATMSKIAFSSGNPVQGVITPSATVINELNPVSVAPTLQYITVALTNKASSGSLNFRFGKSVMTQVLAQAPTILTNGLFISVAVIKQGSQYFVQVNLTDANGKVYATGQQLMTVNIDFANIGFNVDVPSNANPAAIKNPSTAIINIPIQLGQQVLYQQGNNTTPVYNYYAPVNTSSKQNSFTMCWGGPGYGVQGFAAPVTITATTPDYSPGKGVATKYTLSEAVINTINACLGSSGTQTEPDGLTLSAATDKKSTITYTIIGNTTGKVILTTCLEVPTTGSYGWYNGYGLAFNLQNPVTTGCPSVGQALTTSVLITASTSQSQYSCNG